MALVHEFGGQELRIPKTEASDTWAALVEVVAEAATRKLAAGLGGGEPIYIALCARAVKADRLIGYWGGSPLAIPNLKEVIWSRTQDKIRAEYDRLTLREGYSGRDACFALAIEFRVTNKAILNAINKPDNVLAEAVPQGDLF